MFMKYLREVGLGRRNSRLILGAVIDPGILVLFHLSAIYKLALPYYCSLGVTVMMSMII